MGTRKKFLLASLAGLAMVLAFVLGAMPGYDTARLAASSGQISMQDILDYAFSGEKQNLAVQSQVQAVIVKTPAGAEYITPEIPLPLTLNSSVGNVPVRYVGNVRGDNTVWAASANPNNPGGAGTWTGGANRQFTDPAVFTAPYAATLDIGAFVTGQASSRALMIYGLANAALQSGQVASITYTNATVDPYQVTLTEVDGDVFDIDNNGIPDNPFDAVAEGEIWTATVDLGDGQTRNVIIVNLASAGKAGAVFANPVPGVTITAPSTAELIGEGAIAADETALLLVEVVDELALLLDAEAVNGFASPAAWAAAVAALPPVSARSVAGPIVDISIVVNGPGGLSELASLPETLPVTLTLENLAVGPDEELSLFSISTAVSAGGDGLVLGNSPGAQSWNLVQSGLGAGTVSVDLENLSAFVPFLLPALNITSVSPSSALEGEEVALTLSGTIPVATAQSIAQAAAAYQVTVNGTAATFRNGPADAAIDALVNNATNAMYLYWTASITTKATQNAEVVIEALTEGGPVELQRISNAIAITPTFTVAASAGAGGSASIVTAPNAPNGRYAEGSSVAISAVAATGFEFLAWQGLEEGEANTATTTITVNGNRSVTATFQEIGSGGDTFTLTINRAGNGAGTVTPLTPLTVDAGSTVTITATPSSSSKFTGWSGDIATVADASAQTTTVVVNANITLTATFEKKTPADEVLTLTGLDAAGGTNSEGQVEVWMFGGETIRLNGTGLVAGAGLVSFRVGTLAPVTADLFNVAPDGSFGLVVVPPTNATGSDAFFVAELRVRRASDNAEFNLGNVIRYRQYDTGEDGVTTSAFIYDGGAINVSTGEGNTNFATLTLPDLGNSGFFGLVRAGVADSKKQNTQPVPGPVGTNPINAGLQSAFAEAIPGFNAGQTILPGTLDFAFYLYANPGFAIGGEKSNTGSVGAPSFVPVPSTSLPFSRGTTGQAGSLPNPADPEGNKGDFASFQVALANGVINHGDVRDGLTVWGVETEYDYVTDAIRTVQNPQVAYQSEILSAEVTPNVQGETGTPDSTPVTSINMRLYTLNGFSLRQNVTIPPAVGDGVRLNTTAGTEFDTLAGGKALTIVSPEGGLAWIERVDFRIGNTTVGTVTNFTTARGSDEYVLQLNAPASSQAGVASIVLTGRANTNAIQTVNLQSVFEFRGGPAQQFPVGLLLILLGLLAALLGLAAGGSSGGGGGGPCFIATAAYGTPLDGNIDALRDFRDEYMLNNVIGTAAVDAYYRVSPAIADTVATSPVLAAAVRVLLVPVVFLGKMAVTSPALLALVALSIGFFFWSKRKGARQS